MNRYTQVQPIDLSGVQPYRPNFQAITETLKAAAEADFDNRAMLMKQPQFIGQDPMSRKLAEEYNQKNLARREEVVDALVKGDNQAAFAKMRELKLQVTQDWESGTPYKLQESLNQYKQYEELLTKQQLQGQISNPRKQGALRYSLANWAGPEVDGVFNSFQGVTPSTEVTNLGERLGNYVKTKALDLEKLGYKPDADLPGYYTATSLQGTDVNGGKFTPEQFTQDVYNNAIQNTDILNSEVERQMYENGLDPAAAQKAAAESIMAASKSAVDLYFQRRTDIETLSIPGPSASDRGTEIADLRKMFSSEQVSYSIAGAFPELVSGDMSSIQASLSKLKQDTLTSLKQSAYDMNTELAKETGLDNATQLVTLTAAGGKVVMTLKPEVEAAAKNNPKLRSYIESQRSAFNLSYKNRLANQEHIEQAIMEINQSSPDIQKRASQIANEYVHNYAQTISNGGEYAVGSEGYTLIQKLVEENPSKYKLKTQYRNTGVTNPMNPGSAVVSVVNADGSEVNQMQLYNDSKKLALRTGMFNTQIIAAQDKEFGKDDPKYKAYRESINSLAMPRLVTSRHWEIKKSVPGQTPMNANERVEVDNFINSLINTYIMSPDVSQEQARYSQWNYESQEEMSSENRAALVKIMSDPETGALKTPQTSRYFIGYDDNDKLVMRMFITSNVAAEGGLRRSNGTKVTGGESSPVSIEIPLNNSEKKRLESLGLLDLQLMNDMDDLSKQLEQTGGAIAELGNPEHMDYVKVSRNIDLVEGKLNNTYKVTMMGVEFEANTLPDIAFSRRGVQLVKESLMTTDVNELVRNYILNFDGDPNLALSLANDPEKLKSVIKADILNKSRISPQGLQVFNEKVTKFEETISAKNWTIEGNVTYTWNKPDGTSVNVKKEDMMALLEDGKTKGSFTINGKDDEASEFLNMYNSSSVIKGVRLTTKQPQKVDKFLTALGVDKASSGMRSYREQTEMMIFGNSGIATDPRQSAHVTGKAIDIRPDAVVETNLKNKGIALVHDKTYTYTEDGVTYKILKHGNSTGSGSHIHIEIIE